MTPTGTNPSSGHFAADFWGGLAAMLVALPAAIAFGVTAFTPLGAGYAGQGALAGMLGAFAVGLVAAIFGGTQRLISAPCAPAAAVLSAVALGFAEQGFAPETALVLLALTGVLCALLQIAFGAMGLGRLIKYMPYPVVSGYLSGVGFIIMASQLPRFLGVPKEITFWSALFTPSLWDWRAIAVGGVTVVVMLGAQRVTRAVPAVILALAAGLLGYGALGFIDASMRELSGNPLVVGAVASDAGFVASLAARWEGLNGLRWTDLAHVLVPAATLAVLLSIDTLKTCVVLDALTRSRHESNRELVGQGLGNLAASVVGGVQGAGTMGATLVNISSGAQTRVSGIIEGTLALLVFLLLGGLIAWIPTATLAGILIVIGARMLDRHSLALLKSRSTLLDFASIAVVAVVALTVSLIVASAAGIALAIFLFIREQVGGNIIRRHAYGNQMFSKQVRLPDEMAILEQRGGATAIFELQGSLFFGTSDQLYSALAPDIKTCRFLVLDMRRVQTIDVTAVHMLEQMEAMLSERGGQIVFSQLPRSLPSGRDMEEYFNEVGLTRSRREMRAFPELDDALEWVENHILDEERLDRLAESPLELRELDLFQGRKQETLEALEAIMEKRLCRAGERICSAGETGRELFLIRRGLVRIMLPVDDKQSHHLATFGRGDFFGEVSFLDNETRSADAMAFADTELFVLTRDRFDAFAEEHHKLALQVMEGLARKLASRLRYTNAELRYLESS